MTATNLTTFLWFDHQALDAATYYVDLFPNSRLGNVSYYQADTQRPEGSVMTVDFELFGRPFSALNGGPQFPHSEAVSFKSRARPKTTLTEFGMHSLAMVDARVSVVGAKTAGE